MAHTAIYFSPGVRNYWIHDQCDGGEDDLPALQAREIPWIFLSGRVAETLAAFCLAFRQNHCSAIHEYSGFGQESESSGGVG